MVTSLSSHLEGYWFKSWAYCSDVNRQLFYWKIETHILTGQNGQSLEIQIHNLRLLKPPTEWGPRPLSPLSLVDRYQSKLPKLDRWKSKSRSDPRWPYNTRSTWGIFALGTGKSWNPLKVKTTDYLITCLVARLEEGKRKVLQWQKDWGHLSLVCLDYLFAQSCLNQKDQRGRKTKGDEDKADLEFHLWTCLSENLEVNGKLLKGTKAKTRGNSWP